MRFPISNLSRISHRLRATVTKMSEICVFRLHIVMLQAVRGFVHYALYNKFLTYLHFSPSRISGAAAEHVNCIIS